MNIKDQETNTKIQEKKAPKKSFKKKWKEENPKEKTETHHKTFHTRVFQVVIILIDAGNKRR